MKLVTFRSILLLIIFTCNCKLIGGYSGLGAPDTENNSGTGLENTGTLVADPVVSYQIYTPNPLYWQIVSITSATPGAVIYKIYGTTPSPYNLWYDYNIWDPNGMNGTIQLYRRGKDTVICGAKLNSKKSNYVYVYVP